MKKYRFIDHTGDLGVEIFGENLFALFRHAGEAFTEIITDPDTIQPADSKHISLNADRVEDLLVHWLNEFIFMFDAKGLLISVFDIDSVDARHIDATVRGEIYDKARHEIKTTVKSATYHQLKVARENHTWKAQVIFDL